MNLNSSTTFPLTLQMTTAAHNLYESTMELGVSGQATTAPYARLDAFRSCPDLLGYMKAQAARFSPGHLGIPGVVAVASAMGLRD